MRRVYVTDTIYGFDFFIGIDWNVNLYLNSKIWLAICTFSNHIHEILERNPVCLICK